MIHPAGRTVVRRRRLMAMVGALLPVPLLRAPAAERPFTRVRPGDPGWPSQTAWAELSGAVGGRLSSVDSPLAPCRDDPIGPACNNLFRELKNPYYIGDDIALTQTTGWVDAWSSQPSAYAVAAETTEDVVAAVNFARLHNLRLVVRGGGHSYLGTSNAPDSLAIWTRRMNAITLHDAFVPQGCTTAPQPAVTVGAGAIWMHTYNEVTTRGGRYVQGGGCGTVGVAGLVQGGGFGSFSKNYGTAAAGLLEAEIVTADGAVRIANACTNADLFWALKGGGGGTFGVVTRMTLRTRDLPALFGGVFTTIQASSDDAFRRLIARFLRFYAESLSNPNWGEIVTARPGNMLVVRMVFQGLDRQAAYAIWHDFLAWVAASSPDFFFVEPPRAFTIPARHAWDPAFLTEHASGAIVHDDRPNAPRDNVFWSGNQGEAGHYLFGFESVWMPRSLLEPDARHHLADAMFAATRHWQVELHFQKGLANAPEAEIAAARDTATNPAVLDAFALAIIAGEGPPAFPGILGHEPDVAAARHHATAIAAAMRQLRAVVADPGSYVAESSFFEADWQKSYWGENYPRLQEIKQKYDPEGLFYVHHGVGSEDWTADGFAKSTP